MPDVHAYHNDFENKWCPGCGNFGILDAMKDALASLSIPPEKILIVSGIGQAAKTPHFMQCNLFHGLHGRALPVATGAKIANQRLRILVNSGDGDCYGEGGNHFMHAIRRNIDVTLLVHNNKIYGLTKGQASPTTDFGTQTRIQKHGVINEAFNPLAVALSLGAGFVARGFSGNVNHLSRLIQKGITYKGFSLIDILQPCIAFNPVNTLSWYKKRVYSLEQEGYQPGDWLKALEKSKEWGDRIPVGLIYLKEKSDFLDHIPLLKDSPLISARYEREKLQSQLNKL